MRLQRIISILFIACFLNLEVFGTQGLVAAGTEPPASSLDLNNFAGRLNILNDCLFNDIAEIEATELYENRKIRKSGRVLSSQQLFASIYSDKN